jgi:hypothetical protein
MYPSNIKEALAGNKQGSTIKINEVKFVAADPLTGDVSVAAQIAAQTLGPEFKQWLNDPQKLLQLIAAAEGASAGGGTGQELGADSSVGQCSEIPGRVRYGAVLEPHLEPVLATGTAPAWTGGVVPLQEEEVIQAIRLLTRFGQVQQEPGVKEEDLQKELKETDPNTRLNLQQLLGSWRPRRRRAEGRHASVDEGRRAHGDPLRAGALSEGRSQSKRGPSDDGAHEPADGLAALRF